MSPALFRDTLAGVPLPVPTRRLLAPLAAALAAPSGACEAPPGAAAGSAAIFSPDSESALIAVRGDAHGVHLETGSGTAFVPFAPEQPPLIGGLRANRAHTARIELTGGGLLGPYHFRTAPDPTAAVSFRLLVGRVPAPEASSWREPWAETDADFAVLLADETAVGDFLAAPAAQSLMRQRAAFAVFGGGDVARWREHFPTRGGATYRSARWGALVELFFVDASTYRSAAGAGLVGVLGDPQLDWLRGRLGQSSAPFRLVFHSAPVDDARARADLFELLGQSSEHTALAIGGSDRPIEIDQPLGIKEYRCGQKGYCEILVAGGANPHLEVRLRDRGGDLIQSRTIGVGSGELVVLGEPGRPFRTLGAHAFEGEAPRTFGVAPVGRYVLTWLDNDEVETGELEVGGQLVLGSEP